ncbi:MAG: hypothetical protein QUV05_12245 [Phycisphaerae bacterium]|nr:hypothetical protein [Phycisphaerae bacterium]
MAGLRAHPSGWATGLALSDKGRAAETDPNTADPTTVIGGGSIVIHK